MQDVKKYQELLKKLVSLQQKLIQIFESNAEITPLKPDFIDEFGGEFSHIVKPEQSISQIVRTWPNYDTFSLHLFVKPRVGVIRLERKNWLFNIHGSVQVSFFGLPSGLDAEILKQLQRGEMDALVGKPSSGAEVEAQYLREGRTDGVSAWSMFVFANSIDSGSHFSESEHQRCLEALVDEGLLLRWPDLLGREDYFVFAAID